MRNYRIAFLTADWNYELVESTLHGMKKFVEDHENVHLCIFDCFGKDQDNAKGRSEYAIFDLPDLSQFDGLMIQGNQIVLGRIRDEIAAKVAETGIPAVTIDCPVEGCTLVGIDNEKAQYAITEHLITEHAIDTLVYLTGLLENGCPEGKQRMAGFLGACRDCGIPEENTSVIEGTWRTSDGIDVASSWLKEGRPLPNAFVCANDEMALGIMQVLEDNGYSIPADVLVAGFDNVASAELSSPRLSTVNRDNALLNYTAMEILLRKIDGEELPPCVPFDFQLVCSETCGCRNVARPDYIRNKYFHQTRFLKNFYTLQDQMAEEMFDAADLRELLDIVEKNHHMFGCSNIYLCINDYYFDNYDKKQWEQDSEVFGENMILAACGKTDLQPNHFHQYARFPRRDLLPAPLPEEERFLVFYPLHYNTYSIGYFVMNGISEAAKLNLHESIFNFLEIAIENVRKKCLLRQLNEVLDDLYVHDALTGLYNRFGFERFGQEMYARFLENEGKVQILFIDMDDLKGINDRFGHELGDTAIRTTAQLLQKSCSEHDFLMRYGGDEFLVIASGQETELLSEIRRRLEQHNLAAKLPFPLNLSIGTSVTVSEEHRTLEECIQEADAQMYELKKKRKREKNS